tara:strand:+ start:5167 stop:5481 length:315 start_codon:yes stop_codon:yes gene_type:complete
MPGCSGVQAEPGLKPHDGSKQHELSHARPEVVASLRRKATKKRFEHVSALHHANLRLLADGWTVIYDIESGNDCRKSVTILTRARSSTISLQDRVLDHMPLAHF